ncbi:striatin-3 [Cricetulus griseus]|uniref:Striatin-3 n=1 Tax=Cricetulus griseus TaxID=10029 RepID=A0A061HTY9_CRIGR|nr:striatin-3 [Cricetulus griseus]
MSGTPCAIAACMGTRASIEKYQKPNCCSGVASEKLPYLEEVGYTDTILDMRSKRVRSLLGRSVELNGATEPIEGPPRASPGPGGLSGGESLLVKQIEEQIKR